MQERANSRLSELGLSAVLERVRDLASGPVAARAQATDEERRWPEENFRALQAAGLGGLVVPASCGGLGQGLFALARVCEELGKSCASTAIGYGMHCVGAAVIAARATPDQEERYLRPIAAGRHWTTLALSEPGTGSHFYFPQTSLLRLPHGTLHIVGKKSFVTNGGHADSYVVSTVAAEPDAPPGQFSCVAVGARTAGLHWEEPWAGVGMRGNSARGLTLDARVPAADLLGKEGDQIWYVFNVVAPYFLIAMAGTYLGIAANALETARAHLAARRYEHTGAALADQPVLQRELGILWRKVERTRRLVYYAAAEGDAGSAESLIALCSAKAEVADCAVEAVNAAMTLVGGIGYRAGGSLERSLRDARAAHVMAPTTLLLETWMGRALLGLPLLAE